MHNSADFYFRIVQMIPVHTFCWVEPPQEDAKAAGVHWLILAERVHRLVRQWHACLSAHGDNF
jgi:hypothetical protein